MRSSLGIGFFVCAAGLIGCGGAANGSNAQGQTYCEITCGCVATVGPAPAGAIETCVSMCSQTLFAEYDSCPAEVATWRDCLYGSGNCSGCAAEIEALDACASGTGGTGGSHTAGSNCRWNVVGDAASGVGEFGGDCDADWRFPSGKTWILNSDVPNPISVENPDTDYMYRSIAGLTAQIRWRDLLVEPTVITEDDLEEDASGKQINPRVSLFPTKVPEDCWDVLWSLSDQECGHFAVDLRDFAYVCDNSSDGGQLPTTSPFTVDIRSVDPLRLRIDAVCEGRQKSPDGKLSEGTVTVTVEID